MASRTITDISELADAKGVVELQTKLGLSSDFFKRLLKEDDWSFVIKLHALLEAVCSDLLTHRLAEPGLAGIVSRLELSNKTCGKMAFIKELELLDEESRRFISTLSEWRNNFVHNVQNCNASLSAIVDTMNSNELKQFVKCFAPHAMRMQRIAKMSTPLGNPINWGISIPDQKTLAEQAKKDPKSFIWLAAYDLLASMADKYDYNEYLHYDRALQMTGEYDEDDDLPEELWEDQHGETQEEIPGEEKDSDYPMGKDFSIPPEQ
jgi:hypothetical protein